MEYKSYRKEPWINPKVEERASYLHGRGLYAKEPIEKDEVVIIWGGNFVNTVEANKAKQSGKAIQQIDENLWDVFDYETRNNDPSYNHNHSCDPNTWMRDEVTIMASRNINKDEELTIDYAMFILDEDWIMPEECKCGSSLCRHVITGRDWQRTDLQKRYSGHFLPFLQKKIQHHQT